MSVLNTVLLSLIVGVISGVLSNYGTKALDRYLSRRTARALNSRIASTKFRVELLSKLDASPKALLIFPFLILFVVIAMVASGFVASCLLRIGHGQFDGEIMIQFTISFIVLVLSIYAISVFKELDSFPQSISALNSNLEELQAREKLDAGGPNKSLKPTNTAQGDR